MTTIPSNNILVANGDYTFAIAHGAGWPVSIEVSGTFGGATVLLGFTSSDAVPVFIADVAGSGEVPVSKTVPGRWITTRPSSGLPALRVSGATGSTAILVTAKNLSR